MFRVIFIVLITIFILYILSGNTIDIPGLEVDTFVSFGFNIEPT